MFRADASKALAPVGETEFVQGVAADKVVEQGVDSKVVLRSVGENLARFHSVSPATAPTKLRTYREGGACLVWDHMRGDILQKIKSCPHTRDHAYASFYEARLGELQTSMKLEGLPSGPLHGDCFLDNVLADPKTGKVAGFVDLEDFTLIPGAQRAVRLKGEMKPANLTAAGRFMSAYTQGGIDRYLFFLWV